MSALTWALCISTINRLEVLKLCVQQALAQSRAPSEIIVIDAGHNWKRDRDEIYSLVSGYPEIRFVYEQAPMRSLPAQRNAAIQRAKADILFLIDDDSLMHTDCAEIILGHYERDPDALLAAIGATRSAESPIILNLEVGAQKPGLSKAEGRLLKARRSRLGRLFWKQVVLMSLENTFIGYDDRNLAKERAALARMELPGLVPKSFLGGFTVTVRREVALNEPFDDGLITYAPAEDLDATYRFGRHGFVARADDARLFHYMADSNRVERQTLQTLRVLNRAYFAARNSRARTRHFFAFQAYALRSIPANLLKDLAARRWRMPQTRGVIHAFFLSFGVFACHDAKLKQWYRDLQARLIGTTYRIE